jgi:hypothetical protein
MPPITTSSFLTLLALVCVTNEFYVDGGPSSAGLGTRQTNTLHRNITKITPTQKQTFGLEKIKNENLFNLLLKVKTKKKNIIILLFMLPSDIS